MAAPPTRAWRSPTRAWWAPLAPALAIMLAGCSGGTIEGRPVALPSPTAYTAQPGSAGQQTQARQAGVDDNPTAVPPPDASTVPSSTAGTPTTDSPPSDFPTSDTPTSDSLTTTDQASPNTPTEAPPPPALPPGPLPPQSSYIQSLCQGYRETVAQEGVEATIRQVETTNPMWTVLSPNDKAITLEAIRMAGRGCR